jgi:hypothetical protein
MGGSMTLGEMISTLERKDPKANVFCDFCRIRPGKLSSYRGYYDQLALSFDPEGEVVTVAGLLMELKSAIGKKFTGYKGGEYLMDERTQVWVSNYGYASGYLIVDIVDGGYDDLFIKVSRID